MPLLDYFLSGEYESLKLGDMLSGLTYGTCLSPLLELNWRKRPLVGYYDVGFVYRLDIPDKTFVQVFSTALTRLLNKETTIDALQIRECMHQMLLRGWSDNHLHNPLTLYADVEKIIDKHKSHDTITSDFIGNLMTYNTFAVKKSYKPDSVGYELDYEGMTALADMLKVLGLDNLQGASHYIYMVDGLGD